MIYVSFINKNNIFYPQSQSGKQITIALDQTIEMVTI